MKKHSLLNLMHISSIFIFSAVYSAANVEIIRTDIPPYIDGLLNDACWTKAKPVTDFFYKDSGVVKPSKFPTRAQFLYDETGIFVAIECGEEQMNSIVAQTREKDGRVWEDDCVEVFLHPPIDLLRYYHFIVNPAGSTYDALCLFEVTLERRPKWEGNFESAVSRTANSWTVEMYIPFASLSLEPKGYKNWKINIGREHKAGGLHENSSLANGVFHDQKQFLTLKGIEQDFSPFYITLKKFSIGTVLAGSGQMSAMLNIDLSERADIERNLRIMLDIIPAQGTPASKTMDMVLKPKEEKSVRFKGEISKGGQYDFNLFITDKNTRRQYLSYSHKEEIKAFTPMEIIIKKQHCVMERKFPCYYQ